MNKLVFAWLVGVVVLVVSAPVSAATQTAAITDPIGDATWHFSSGAQSASIPTYQDIVTASVSKKGMTFTFSMDMAGAIPAAPFLSPDGLKLNIWVWAFTSDPAFSACGDPLPPSFCPNVQFEVRFNWDGTAFSAFLLDRRPLATGGSAIETPVAFSISGVEIQVFVDASSIGSPSSFAWFTFTGGWMSPHLETWGNTFLDLAPENFAPVPWPA